MKNKIYRSVCIGLSVVTFGVLAGCNGPSITAVRLSPSPVGQAREPEGIPYYLPKPYLFVTKNFYYIPAPTLGLTAVVNVPGTFDPSGNSPASSTKSGTNDNSSLNPSKSTSSQSNNPAGNQTNSDLLSDDVLPEAASASAASDTNNPTAGAGGQSHASPSSGDAQNGKLGVSTNSSSASVMNGGQVLWAYPGTNAMIPAPASDGLIPQEYFTYQIIYLPDLTQKYGLRIKGNYGELRATENLINGWMHTGPGPFYMKNSSSSDMVTAVGQATGSILQSIEQGVLSGLGIPTAPGGSTSSPTPKTAGHEGGGNTNGFTITNYAVLYVFEPRLTSSNTVEWRQICQLTNPPGPISFDRDVVSVAQQAGPPGTSELSTNSSLEMQITNFVTTNYAANYKFIGLSAPPKTFASSTAIDIGGGIQTTNGSPVADAALQAFNKGQLPKDVVSFLRGQPNTNWANISVQGKLTNAPPSK